MKVSLPKTSSIHSTVSMEHRFMTDMSYTALCICVAYASRGNKRRYTSCRAFDYLCRLKVQYPPGCVLYYLVACLVSTRLFIALMCHCV